MNLLTIIIGEPTSDGDICKIPYRLTSDNSTANITREMWFCYKNECKTKNEQKAKCESGRYLSKMRVN